MTLASIVQKCQARRRPILLVAGITWLIGFQALHFGSVLGITQNTPLAQTAELVRANITPFAWCAYLLLLLGILAVWDRRSWLWRFRNRFALLWLWSVPAWCYFDWMNFYFMRDPHTGLRAWEYFNLPPRFEDRVLGYLVAFGAIAPGMFLTAEVLQRLGFWKLNGPSPATHAPTPTPAPLPPPRTKTARILPITVLALGIFLTPIPILVGTPASNLAIWVGTWALLDPINFWCRRPSIVGDWLHRRFGRTLALGTAGLLCGLLWEFWNFWAATKWTYHLPFLGTWEHYRYFEMPIPGLIGFIAFALETWAMWQSSLLLLHPFVEGDRDPQVQTYACT